MKIEKATLTDAKAIFTLYKAVAEIPDGIIRQPNEITTDYIMYFLDQSLKNGLILVAKEKGEIVGEIHAYSPPIFAFQHLLTDLTIVVHPKHQGKGIGKKLFLNFLKIVESAYSHILRVELFVREHNERNVAFYKKLGFINEGRQENKIFSESGLETPLHMVWFNPNFIK
jgi:putative acetyltransferase